MKITTEYSESELEKGECTYCSEKSDEILIDNGICVDCIEEINFFNETMKGL